MSPSPTTKDTIYIDVDDEITAIIDKVVQSPKKIVALVLPKRAAVLQSVVNMKLLKRAADDVKKRVVLITAEAGLLPLAGAVGLHVAKTLQSRPAIPPAPVFSDTPVTIETEVAAGDVEPELDPAAPVGELAGLPPEGDEETIEVDNREEIAPAAAAVPKPDKKLKIPNFERFRLRLLLGIGGLILLILLWFLAGSVLPKAKIVIKTDTSSVTSNLEFAASQSAKEFDAARKVLPAQLKEVKKTEAEKVPATGQKDIGSKATGTVKLYNCSKEDKLADVTRTVPAGTGVSAGDKTFILAEDVKVEPSSFSGNTCQKNRPSDETKVNAQASGDQYNLGARAYTVAGFPSMSADGSAMTGGTSKIVKVVSEQDIENAKQKIAGRQGSNALEGVQQELKKEGLFGIGETFTSSPAAITASPAVGQEGTETTVTSIITHSMLGVKEEDLKKLLEEDVTKQIDTAKQQIQSNELDKAVFRIIDKKSPGEIKLSVQSLTVVGPRLDIDGLKKEVAGKKRGDTLTAIEGRPGIRDVSLEYSPFWVYATPKKPGRIQIIVEQADGGR